MADATGAEHAHIWFLLDRSGSMESIRPAVVEGLADFLREQHAADPRARFTLVQFDDEDPQEVVVDGRALADVAPLTSEGYEPRGSTPLYDATGYWRCVSTRMSRAARTTPTRWSWS
jgi:Mg-chelatase subunit ChlD